MIVWDRFDDKRLNTPPPRHLLQDDVDERTHTPRPVTPPPAPMDGTTADTCLSSSECTPLTMPLKGEHDDQDVNSGHAKSTHSRERGTTAPSSSSSSSSSGGSGGVMFDKNVSVLLIPTRKEYPSDLRESLWLDRREYKANKARNLKEFEAEGFDWRNVTDDEDMVLNEFGKRIHPIHYGQRWFHITCQMAKHQQQVLNGDTASTGLAKPKPVRPKPIRPTATRIAPETSSAIPDHIFCS